MASIDERVVAMSFENLKFESGVAVTMGTLAKLNASIAGLGKNATGFADIEKAAAKVNLQAPMSALDKLRARLGLAGQGSAEAFGEIEKSSNKVSLLNPMSALDKLQSRLGQVGTGADAGFSNIEKSSNRVNLLGLNSAIDSVTSRFSAMTVVAASALNTIVTDATRKGKELVNALSLGPISGGLQEYTTNLNSIQTILANTEASGAGLQDVNSALQDLNTYSDQTIYNFSQMAQNIGTFTAAGVDLETATQSIKGIANLAALSGSNSEQASRAMYQLSQAIAAGRVSLQDWNSVVNSGMGGTVFQRALANTAQAMGTLSDGAVQLKGKMKNVTIEGESFRESINATTKKAKSSTSEVKKAQEDAAQSVADAQEAAAESVANANRRVVDAQKGVAEASKQTAEAVANASDSVKDAEEGVAEAARQSAESVKSAKKDVADAQQAVADATKQSTRDIKAAISDQNELTVASAASVKSALLGVAEARRRLVEAMKPPSADELTAASDNLLTAQLDQADLADAVTQAQRDQTRASEDLAKAQERLKELQSSGASTEDIASAQRTVEDAQRRVADSADAVTRALITQRDAARGVKTAQDELTETQKKGTKGDKNRKDSQDALTQALSQYKQAQKDARDASIEAERAVTKARRDGAKSQEEAVARLAAAESKAAETRRDSARSQEDAAKRLIDAEQAVSDARADGAEREAKAASALIDAQRDQVKATKDAQKQIADAHERAAESIENARQSMSGKGSSSWLTSDVLTATLAQFTGDLTKAELKAKGFNDEQIKAIQQTAKTAKAAATQVKDLGQLFAVAKEAIGTGWSDSFKLIFGNFKEAKETFTGFSQDLGKIISNSADMRNKVLGDWNELGGRTELIKGIKAAFEALGSVLTPLKEAFRDIFPRKTGEDLFELTVRFREFMEELKIGPETAENLKRSFRGLFALLHIGTTIVSGILGVIFDLLGVVGDGSGGFLAFTGSIGDFLVAVDDAISKGKGLSGVFEGLSNVLRTPLELLKAVASAIGGLFGETDGASADDISGAFDRMAASAGPLESALRAVAKVWEQFFNVMQDIGEFILPILNDVRDVFASIGDKVVEGLEGVDYDKVMTAIQTTFLGGLAIGIKKLLGGIGVDLTGGLVKNFKKVTDTLSGTLVAIQRNVNARTMLLIAGAVLALAAATIIFSQIDAKKLAQAMTAISVGIGQLVGAMALLTKVGGKGAFLTLPFIAASMLILASALVILGAAVKIFSTMSWEELAKGLSGVAVGLAAIAAATKFMGPGIILIGPGLIAVAIAMNLLAVAMKIFGGMKWEEIAKGLVGISGALLAVGIAVKGLGPGMLVTGPGLILVAAGLILLSGAVSSFGNLDLKTMGKGLLGIAASLIVLGVAISAIPPTIAIQAAGLVILSVALTGIAAAVGAMGSLGILTIAKGLTAIAAALVIFAVGLTAMAGTLPGSVALLAAAAAFAVLTPALVVLGSLKWSTIIKGLGAIALTLGVLAVAGALAAGPLTALGVAMIALSASVLVIGAGIYLMAKGFSLLGSEGVKGVSVMIAAITAFIALLPKMVIDFLKGLVEILTGLAKLAPQIAESLVSILKTWFTALEDLLPQAAELIGKLLAFIIQTIEEHSGPLIDAGFQMLVKFLSGIANNIGKVTENVVLIITRFLTNLAESAPRLAASGASFLAAWLKGIADNIGKVISQATHVIVKFLEGVVTNLPKVYAAGVKVITTYLKSVADAVPKIIRAGVDIVLRLIGGIGDALPRLVEAAVDMIIKFVRAIGRQAPRIADAGAKAVIDFLNGMARAIRNNDDQLIDAAMNLGDAIIDGILKALSAGADRVKDKIIGIVKSPVGAVKDLLGISSPSKVFIDIGNQILAGLAIGVTDKQGLVSKSMTDTADDVVKTASDAFRKVPDILNGMTDMDPVIRPVLDLSNVRKGAQEINDLASITPITAAPSFRQAAAISEEQQASMTAQAEQEAADSPTFIFEQNNTSPESLSEIEIYRQTSNQLAQAKSVLGLAP